ncbi:MAG: hypothetical protein HYZ57_07545 [Acidobacteria bacterium]|nr:hypothetical protein [Acidobacteriota bacterium]MBI3279676.1 hypothetical protein [Acidobacteriota bacterium]
MEPPPDLVRRVAEREAAAHDDRSAYMYRQTVIIQEFSDRGLMAGEYREVRDIIFLPGGERAEQAVDKPRNTLKRLKLTEEDFRDIRQVQPLLFTRDRRWSYEVQFRGEETIDGVACWVLRIRPRQILSGQRLFDGLAWVDQRDCSIVRLAGQAVPQILSTRPEKENLFPHFTTVRDKVGEFWFPLQTYADDTLYFSSGPQRIRMVIRYSNYQRFAAESKISISP